MFVRDPWTTETWSQAGPVVINALSGDPVPTTDQVQIRQLHALAMAIYQAQQDVKAAQARGDVAYVQARIQDVERLRDAFQVKAAQFQSGDADVLGAIAGFLAGVALWLLQPLAALPSGILDGVTRLGVKAGVSAVSVALPLVALAGLLLWVVSRAEKSRTYRKYVA